MIKALIFDFDGLIIDTESTDYLSWQEAFTALGCELPLEMWQGYIGTSSLDVVAYLKQQAVGVNGPVDWDDVYRRRQQRDAEMTAALPILPGVVDYLEGARAMGLKTAVASSSPRHWVTTNLSRLGLDHYFDHISCSDDVGGRTKPDPAVYLAALAALGVNPAEAIAFEDSVNGLRAARQAGLFTVAVPNNMTCSLSFAEAQLCLTSLAALPLAQLLAMILPG
jgi:HAD superfamily hydrolase (TIGR01509 family)